MRLSDLVNNIEGVREVRGDCEVLDLSMDSRKVGPGTLFFCIAGANYDGHAFAPQAVRAGAAALVVEHFMDELEVPQVLVVNGRIAMSVISDRFSVRPRAACA